MGPIQTKWLKALRSGEYKQCQRSLTDGRGGYCCLGVAACVLGLPVKDMHFVVEEENDENNEFAIDEELGYDIYKQLGLRSGTGDFYKQDVQGNIGELSSSLIDLNDSLEWDFNKIADFIETNEEAVFEDEV